MGKLLPSLFLIFLFQTSCYEPQEGCLDINATNYDVAADDPCADCCTYPTLSVSALHRVDFSFGGDTSLLFLYDTLYPNYAAGNADSFVIDRARFFISDIKLIKDSGEEVGVVDTLELETSTGEKLTVDDSFVKLDRDIFATRSVGNIFTSGTFKGVKFTIGLDENLLNIDPMSVPSGHPLSIEEDVLNYDTLMGTYLPNLLIYRQDTVSADSIFVKINEPDTLTLFFDAPFELDRGFDAILVLRLDYMKWFDGVNVDEDPLLKDISTAIRQNLRNAFSVEKIESK